MKHLTGNDVMSCRDMYKSQSDIDPQATIFMFCNDVPSTSSCDGGTWRRIRIIEFDHKFVDDPQHPWERRIDCDLEIKLRKWAPAFIWLLVWFRIQYPTSDIPECEEVIAYTNEILCETDYFSMFRMIH